MSGGADATRERILNAATELMLARGLRKVTMEEIAQAIGISKKTLYQAYSSKDYLVRALAEREITTWQARQKALMESHPEVVDQLHAIARNSIEAHRRFGPEIRRDLRADYPDLWERLVERRQRQNNTIERLIERGIAEGKLRPVNPRVAAIALRAAIARVTDAETVQENSFTADEAARDVFELFLHGLLAESPAHSFEASS